MFKVLKDSCIILYKQFENLNQMNNVLEKYNLPKLTPVETDILNRTRVIEEIQKEVKEFHYKRVPCQTVSQGNSSKPKDQTTTVLL